MGAAVIRLEEGADAPEIQQAFTMSEREIETPFYLINLNEAGQIIRLYDKENDREVLAEGERANVLQVFEFCFVAGFQHGGNGADVTELAFALEDKVGRHV